MAAVPEAFQALCLAVGRGDDADNPKSTQYK
jgi:hypothetical protein